jgi:ABC-type phosphate transport system substrate-binding protein
LTTIYGEGGTSANLFWQKMSAEYPYTRDSVSINWAGKAVLQSMADYAAGLVDFIMIDSQLTDDMISQGYYGLPMMGSAMVMVYNIPELNNTQLVRTCLRPHPHHQLRSLMCACVCRVCLCRSWTVRRWR